ncbi:MAG TPA: LysE family translocator [Candidatus Pelagibacter bacterium]|jgi:threonine/homoserine/homoserine lactone efflux protein|nr:lysine transporter LysE [Pelagibacteraceae bacterium]HJN84110.1 LysE family translocator [Candidatus Pelagibacter bacterium]|tara:strand:+ start:284 stop:886 length:603 start_codon:yes stop_codon:yes gene_type:complete
MIDQNLFIALISFYFVMYVTPGPNNAMVLTSGIKFGYLKTIPHMSGITIGHVLQVVLVCLGLGKLFQMFPQIQNILKIICAIYLLYLGYKIIGSFSKIKEDGSRPLKFYEASLFQLVNPKAWTISTMVASGFLPKDERLVVSILFISITALVICPISISIWAVFGSGIRNLVKNNKKKAIIEYFLAILLLITAILIVIEK